MKRIFEEKMLTEHEKRFMEYWEKHRDREKRVFRQWLIGMPVGVIFVLAIALNFSSGWNKQAAYVANTSFNPMVLVVALVLIASFIAIFSKSHKWDMNEQRYLEFKAKQRKEERENREAAEPPADAS